jgi:hypothetical protein
MIVKPASVDWSPELPIFAKDSFLASVGDEHGWLGGYASSEKMECFLPYTIIRRPAFRMVRFRLEVFPLAGEMDPGREKAFLNEAVRHFRSRGADVIIPASHNALFRSFPDGAAAAPYGTYVIDLDKPEEALWQGIDRITRQNINSARKGGVTIESGPEHADGAYDLIRETFRRSKLAFMGKASFVRFLSGLGDNGLVLAAVHQGVPQSYAVFAFSRYCAYAIYAGNLANQRKGANKLLYWEAIRRFRDEGVRLYDFYGARIDPEPGSKQEALNLFKKRFGARLKQGFIWKCGLNPWKYFLYNLAAKLRSGGDIVDREAHKLEGACGAGRSEEAGD